ncbi:MAG: EAL domain-containing protein [Methylobacterium sp.]|uniref:putative bifunctional diguanylate cyclase/phosphodiesterase n=1 Tax=Methylobacterium sp. TaxID=409 RepID=UPI0025D22926|nr:EAL domain-containing protein [Methylobacterium sp.]MBX9932497.1 EAL domain-containing protein [Methylobacterium sp.]
MALEPVISFLIDTDRQSGPLDADLRRRARVEQLDVALRLVPFTVLVSLSVVQVIVFLYWHSDARFYLAVLEALILPLAFGTLQQCWRWRSRSKPSEVSITFVRRVVMVAFLYGCLLGSIPLMLFGRADADGRLLIAASCAGLIATGMSASVLPRAAIGYSGPIIIGSFAALAMTGEHFYIYVGILLFFYGVFIFFTILHLSRLVTMRVIAQAGLERQQELTHLLLNEFEESASDWLWETDSELCLQHISPRLIEVAGSSERMLQGLPLERLFLPSLAAPAGHPSTNLWQHIRERQAFRNILLPLNIAGDQRVWSLSGKAIFDRNGAFTGYRGVGSDVTEKRRSEERLSYLALHDPLTDLPNRVLFQQRLEAAQAALTEGDRFAVLALDLDEFKNVNDTFGHAAGDALLRAVSQRLRLFASDVLVARLAGDEFAILATGPRIRDDRAIEALASRVIEAIAAPFDIEGFRVSVGVSIGIAIVPKDGRKEIMRRADLALYRMKSEGRNGYRFYEAAMDERIEARRALTTDLRGAMERNEFILFFQPIVSATNGRIRGFEALLRWKHQKRGFVSPAEFIPLAEETGVIIPLGEWIIQEACRIAACWPENIKVAVNLSPIQFRHSDLPLVVSTALRDSGLVASRLELEVTESVFLEATPAVHAMMTKLRRMNVRLSLDDFGTGYSSLSYLRRMAFDKVKIDQSFVRDLPNEKSGAAIVKAIVDLAISLNMTITAEGVETEPQRACLVHQGCHELQGYLFSRPLPVEEANVLAAGDAILPYRTPRGLRLVHDALSDALL